MSVMTVTDEFYVSGRGTVLFCTLDPKDPLPAFGKHPYRIDRSSEWARWTEYGYVVVTGVEWANWGFQRAPGVGLIVRGMDTSAVSMIGADIALESEEERRLVRRKESPA